MWGDSVNLVWGMVSRVSSVPDAPLDPIHYPYADPHLPPVSGPLPLDVKLGVVGKSIVTGETTGAVMLYTVGTDPVLAPEPNH